MSFGNQPADGAGNIMSSAVPDGTTQPYAVAGGPSYTDSGNTKTTVGVYIPDGNNVTQGQKSDSAATNSTSSWSVIALLKGLYTKLAGTLTVGGSVSVSNFPATQPVSSTDGSQATTGTTTDAAYTSGAGTLVALLKGIFTRLAALASLGTDQTGTELKVSVYGTNTTNGDSPLSINSSGAVKTAINSVTAGTTFPTNADTTIGGTTAPAKELLIAGKSNDGTPQYQPVPLGAGGRSIIVEGYAGGTAQPVSAASLPLPSNAAQESGGNLAAAKADLDTIVTNTTGLATSANQATANSSLSSIATNTSNTATNTSTVAGAVSGSKMAVKAASGDFADGSLVTVGTEADAAITSSASSGTLMAFLKGVVSLLSGVLAVKRSAVAVYSLASTAETANGNSGDLTVGLYTEIGIDINITADSGTNETIQFFWDRKGADGVYYPLWQSKTVLSTDSLAEQISTSIGAGMAYAQSIGLTGRLRWVVGGTSPSFTLSANVYGK